VFCPHIVDGVVTWRRMKQGILTLSGVPPGAGQACMPALVQFQPPLLVCCLLFAGCYLLPAVCCLSLSCLRLLGASSPCPLLFRIYVLSDLR
jgi:hypothetical protein